MKDYRNDSVTNDRWISLPEMLGDDYQFKPARQTSYHYELFKCEDDMYEIDIILGHHRSCIKELTRLYEEANAIKSLNVYYLIVIIILFSFLFSSLLLPFASYFSSLFFLLSINLHLLLYK